MGDEIQAMEIEDDDSTEFTLAEVVKMEKLFKKMKEKTMGQEFYQELATKFNCLCSCSTQRLEKSTIKWEQVQRWFLDKQTNMASGIVPSSGLKETVASMKTAIVKKRAIVSTISASEAATELHNLTFEARSAKDYAWFDVSSFLNYKIFSSGELFVRVRFSGFGTEEDEWVSVKRCVRERSIPLLPSECGTVNIGDLVLCYMEGEDHALYCDAHVEKIERKIHDSNECTCTFMVHYDHYNIEGKVRLHNLCCRPRKSFSNGSISPLKT